MISTVLCGRFYKIFDSPMLHKKRMAFCRPFFVLWSMPVHGRASCHFQFLSYICSPKRFSCSNQPKQHVFPTGRKSIPGCKVTAECRKALDEAGSIRVVEFGEMAVAREYLAQIERIPSVRQLIERRG